MQPEILFVDDQRDVLDVGVLTLKEEGYQVTPAASGDIALVILEQGIRYRLLITDVVLPGVLDGFALAHRAKQLVPAIQIIYTTGYGGIVNVRSQGAPYGEVLAKPWKPGELIGLVSKAVGLPSRA
ncbi:MAG TPA: response regulator [Stellaceae bacterium]|nr:response regulator [Stellaceae bacterium]